MANPRQLELSLFEEVKTAVPALSDEAVMAALCEDLLDEAEVQAPPTPVEMLASLRGIVEIKEADQPYAGILSAEDGGFSVRVKRGDGRRRQRFTICHESGHTLLPGFREKRQYRCHADSEEWLERMCDVAAAELILPRRFFAPMISEGDFDLETVEALGEVFDASVEASARRAVALHDEPAMLLVLSDRHKPAERGREAELPTRLRLDYRVRQGPWPFVKSHKSVVSSGLDRALEGGVWNATGNIDELCSEAIGPVRISAKQYGKRVLAMVRRV